MTDTDANVVPLRTLTPIEGRAVDSVAITIPNAGGGLRDALDIEPVEHHIGDEGYLLVQWRMTKLKAEPIMHKGVDTGRLQRVEVFDAVRVAFPDDKLAGQVARALNRDAERIAGARAAREVEGQEAPELEDESDEDARLREAGENL